MECVTVECGSLERGSLERGPLRGLVGIGGGGHQHVLGLDVAMDHPAPVCVPERVGERDPDFEDLFIAQRFSRDQLGEGVALDQLGDQVEGVLLGTGLVQGDDRGMGQAGGGERLARGSLAVFAGGERDRLDGHFAVEQLVVGAPHDPEAAGTEALEQPVAAEHHNAPPSQRRLAASASRGTGNRRALRRDQRVVRVHRLLRSPVRGCSLPRAGRRSGHEREVADGANQEWQRPRGRSY